MSKLQERIAAAEQKLKALKAHQVRAATRQRTRDAKQERRDDLRRKVLVGSTVLDLVERGKIDKSLLMGWLGETVEREEDLELFVDYFGDGSGRILAATESQASVAAGIVGESSDPLP